MQHLTAILQFSRNLWPYYVSVTAFSLLMALASLATPFLIKAATDTIVATLSGAPPDYTLIVWLAVGLFAADVSGTLFSNWGGYLGDVMAAKLKKQLSERYYQHLLSLPQSYFDKELTGTIINRLNRTIAGMTTFLNIFANNFFQMFLTVILSIIIVAFYSWEIAILLVIMYPLFMWLTVLTSKQWQQYEDEKNLQTDIASGRFAEVVSQIKVVKSFIQEKAELAQFKKQYQQTVTVTFKQSKQWHNMDIARRLVLNIIFFMILGFIIWQTLAGRFSLGEMFLLIQLIQLVRMPIFGMSFIVDNIQRAIAGSKDYFAVMAIQPQIADDSGAPSLHVPHGKVAFDSVSFGYTKDKRVLHDITFTVQPGQKVALVGESGEGKTTITNVLMRLYDVTQGGITIDGTDIRTVTQVSLRHAIAVVFQEPALFSGTIIENIAYGNPGSTKAAVIKAAKAANAHDFIDKLENGYDTQIGERGLKLSGGQKQRIAIARAILKDAPILILDEATSSLDSRSEHLVQEALERLMKGRTTLIIAHRLSTIAHVDTIVTLQNGRVDEMGPPHQLAKSGGIYAELLQLQSGTTEAAKKKLKEFEIAV